MTDHNNPQSNLDQTLTLALISEVFYEDETGDKLQSILSKAKAQGAQLAVLPELPLNRWAPATKDLCDEDAEPIKGRRHHLQSLAAQTIGIGLLGGAIVKDPATGTRYNTALLFDKTGHHLGSFRKCHIPKEPDFWEAYHYSQGEDIPQIYDQFDIRFGIQICSDINRPQGALALAAQGAEAVINPRATEAATIDRWRVVFQALAITSGAYILSVNRPRAEQGVLLGGPSVAVDPLGNILVDSTDQISIITIKRNIVTQARKKYPGYLPVRTDLYTKAWQNTQPIPGYQTDW